MKNSEAFAAVRAVLSSAEKWCSDARARTVDGRIVNPRSKLAARWSLYGAINAAGAEKLIPKIAGRILTKYPETMELTENDLVLGRPESFDAITPWIIMTFDDLIARDFSDIRAMLQ